MCDMKGYVWSVQVAIAVVYLLCVRLLLLLASPATTVFTEPRAGVEPQPASKAGNSKVQSSNSDSRDSSRPAGTRGSNGAEEAGDTQPAQLPRPSNKGSYSPGTTASLDPREDSWQLSMSSLEAAYLWGLIPLELYCTFGHPMLFRRGSSDGDLHGEEIVLLPFLPLLLTSVYCGVGIIWAWGKLELAAIADIVDTPHKAKIK